MPEVAEIAWHVSGDIGQVGVTRFRFTRQDAASVTGADCNAAAAATKLVIAAGTAYYPSSITWTCDPEVRIYESDSGAVVPPLGITTIPAPIVGGGSSSHGAGLGLRINWKTSTLSGRRLIKGASYLVPMGQAVYGGDGSIAASVTTAIGTGCASYLTAMTTAALYPVVWHRPKKGTTTGGLTGIVFAGVASNTPAGLRSRRS